MCGEGQQSDLFEMSVLGALQLLCHGRLICNSNQLLDEDLGTARKEMKEKNPVMPNIPCDKHNVCEREGKQRRK